MRLISAALLLLIISSCNKTSGEKDTVAPEVTLLTPTSNQVFTGSQSILISGSTTDNRYVKQIHIEITNQQTGEEYKHLHIHPGSASAAFNELYTVQTGISYRIRVIVDDASANSSMKEASIIVN